MADENIKSSDKRAETYEFRKQLMQKVFEINSSVQIIPNDMSHLRCITKCISNTLDTLLICEVCKIVILATFVIMVAVKG